MTVPVASRRSARVPAASPVDEKESQAAVMVRSTDVPATSAAPGSVRETVSWGTGTGCTVVTAGSDPAGASSLAAVKVTTARMPWAPATSRVGAAVPWPAASRVTVPRSLIVASGPVAVRFTWVTRSSGTPLRSTVTGKAVPSGAEAGAPTVMTGV